MFDFCEKNGTSVKISGKIFGLKHNPNIAIVFFFLFFYNTYNFLVRPNIFDNFFYIDLGGLSKVKDLILSMIIILQNFYPEILHM